MKVFILTEGGGKKGFGHITRCISLYQAFRERKIASTLIVNGDNKIRSLLKGNKFYFFNWLTEKERLFKLVKGADSVVVDSYLARPEFYKRISELVKLPVYLDDYKKIGYPSGVVVNGSVYAKALRYPKNKKVIYLLGSKFIPLRKEFWQVAGKKINREIKNVLVTFGGMEKYGLMDDLSNFLKSKFDFNVTAIDTRNRRRSARIMLSTMLKNDLCISGGGQTIYELARCGLPAIGVCFADNQLLNLQNWEKAGFLRFSGWHNEKNLFGNIENILAPLDYEKRKEMSRIGKDFVDGQGARRIIKEILK